MSDLTSMPRSVYASRLAEFSDIAWAGGATRQNRGRWNEFFARRIGRQFGGRVILEIGCFDAGFLSEIAAKNPGTAFIGIDWKCKAIYDGAKRIAEGKLKNIVLLRTRAQDLGLIFAEAELDEIWIFHPDPCDKEAELKNRLVSEGFLFEAHRVLRDRASLLALKTDHADYYRSVIESFSATPANGMEISVASKDYWNDPPAVAHTASRLFAGNTTLFERRFIKRREPIHYVEFRKAIGFQIVKICRS